MAISTGTGIIALYALGRIRSQIYKTELEDDKSITETSKNKSNLERIRLEKSGIYIFGVILMQGILYFIIILKYGDH